MSTTSQLTPALPSALPIQDGHLLLYFSAEFRRSRVWRRERQDQVGLRGLENEVRPNCQENRSNVADLVNCPSVYVLRWLWSFYERDASDPGQAGNAVNKKLVCVSYRNSSPMCNAILSRTLEEPDPPLAINYASKPQRPFFLHLNWLCVVLRNVWIAVAPKILKVLRAEFLYLKRAVIGAAPTLALADWLFVGDQGFPLSRAFCGASHPMSRLDLPRGRGKRGIANGAFRNNRHNNILYVVR